MKSNVHTNYNVFNKTIDRKSRNKQANIYIMKFLYSSNSAEVFCHFIFIQMVVHAPTMTISRKTLRSIAQQSKTQGEQDMLYSILCHIIQPLLFLPVHFIVYFFFLVFLTCIFMSQAHCQDIMAHEELPVGYL